MKTWITFCLTLTLIVGCNAAPRSAQDRFTAAKNAFRAFVTLPDPNDAEAMAKTHPAVREVCQLAGSCAAVYIRIDQGRIVIDVPGAQGANGAADPLAYAVGVGQNIDEAAEDFVDSYRRAVATQGYRQGARR